MSKVKKYPVDAQKRDRICYLVSTMSLYARQNYADPVRCACLVFGRAWAKPLNWTSHLHQLSVDIPDPSNRDC